MNKKQQQHLVERLGGKPLTEAFDQKKVDRLMKQTGAKVTHKEDDGEHLWDLRFKDKLDWSVEHIIADFSGLTGFAHAFQKDKNTIRFVFDEDM